MSKNGKAKEAPKLKFDSEVVEIATLKPHPRNYRKHPDDELEHLAKSLDEHGVYRNVVVTKDGTILAGHGVVQAALKLGWTQIPVIRLSLSPEDPRALKLLIGDNEIAHLSERDDKLLAGLLKELHDVDADELLGTGWDQMMLANFAMVTRNKSEIADFDAAAHWVGMPEYKNGEKLYILTMRFDSEKEREKFVAKIKLAAKYTRKQGQTWSAWWPPREKDDVKSVRVVQAEA